MQQSVLNYPDFVVFDLDPYLYSGKEARGAEPELHPEGFAATCQAALWLKEMLDSLGLASFVKTTGRTGLHIYVPIQRTLDYHATHSISETMARVLAQQHPGEVTIEWAVDKRRGKVFADYNQNVRGKTLASIYSPRVLPWAAVSMPLRVGRSGRRGVSDGLHHSERAGSAATGGRPVGRHSRGETRSRRASVGVTRAIAGAPRKDMSHAAAAGWVRPL